MSPAEPSQEGKYHRRDSTCEGYLSGETKLTDDPGRVRRPSVAGILIRSALLLVALSFVFFGLAHLIPGGMCRMYPTQTTGDCHASLALNSVPPVQYMHWIGGYVHGDLGRSPSGSRVSDELLGGLPESLLVVLGGLVLYVVLSALGSLLPAKRHVSGLPLIVLAAPVFLVALFLMYVLAIHWPVFPRGGVDDTNIHAFWSDPWFAQLASTPLMLIVNLIKHLFLPALVFSFVLLVADTIMRVPSRAGAIGSRWTVLDRLPLYLSLLFSGLVIDESVFLYKAGLGYRLTEALGQSDFALVIALLMIGSLLLVAAKTVADLALVWRPATAQSL